jgi:hypothetical protein
MNVNCGVIKRLLPALFVCGGLCRGAIFAAATCNSRDVQAAINVTTNGDTVTIPAGRCTWMSGVVISARGITVVGSGTPNTGAGTFGSGTLNTVIVDNVGNSKPLISVSGITLGQTAVISTLDIEPNSGNTPLWSPISLNGFCVSRGCPNIRVSNIGFGMTTQWNESGNGAPADWMIRTDDVVGVIDHCTLPTGSGVMLLNANLSAYLGVGDFGDNSWAQPDSFGGANNIFMENNDVFVNQAVTDCDIAPIGGGVGGCRIAGRFNHITLASNAFSVFAVHGLDTGGRMRGGRQIEAYKNRVTCLGPCGVSAASFRSGTGFVFGNVITAVYPPAFTNNIIDMTVYRTVFTPGGGWAACGGSGPYDTNDRVSYYTGTNLSANGATTLVDMTKSWTPDQFVPSGAPYSVHNITRGWWAEIVANTETTLTILRSIPEQTNTFTTGDRYEILRATVCVDQAGRGAGGYVSGTPPSPAAALSQSLDPIYEWDDTIVGNINHGNVGSDTRRTIANRDWYTDGSNGKPQAQTSKSSPFNGSSGVGWGTMANRPATCTAGVAYWATNQGSWNNSENGEQGVLYKCTAANTWTLYYTPYTYPHPLISEASRPQ